MARLRCITFEPPGDGMRTTTTFDSDWCKHKVSKDYCKICNLIIDKTINLTNKQLIRKLKIPKGFKIQSIHYDHTTLKIQIRFKEKRK